MSFMNENKLLLVCVSLLLRGRTGGRWGSARSRVPAAAPWSLSGQLKKASWGPVLLPWWWNSDKARGKVFASTGSWRCMAVLRDGCSEEGRDLLEDKHG